MSVHEGRARCGAEDADGDGDEHEAGGGSGVVFPALVDDGVGDEEHVQEAVEDGHVEAQEEDDEFAEEELEGADEEDAQAFGERPEVEVLFGDEVFVLLAQLFGSFGEDGGRVGFGHGEGYEDVSGAGED